MKLHIKLLIKLRGPKSTVHQELVLSKNNKDCIKIRTSSRNVNFSFTCYFFAFVSSAEIVQIPFMCMYTYIYRHNFLVSRSLF